MAFTLDDVKSTLEKSGENGKELYETVSNSILNARNDRKTHVVNLETQNSRLSAAIKNMGWDGTSEIDAFIVETKAALESGKTAHQKLTGDQKRLQDLEKSQTDLLKRLNASENALKEKDANEKKAKVKEAVLSKIRDKIFSAELRASHIAESGLAKLGEDGNTVLWVDGQSELKLEDGIQKYLDQNKDDLKNSQKPGPGGKPGGGVPDGKTMSRSAFDALSPAERLAKSKEGMKLTD